MMAEHICHYAKGDSVSKDYKQNWMINWLTDFFFFKIGFHYVNQASLELSEIFLLLPTMYWEDCQVSSYLFF